MQMKLHQRWQKKISIFQLYGKVIIRQQFFGITKMIDYLQKGKNKLTLNIIFFINANKWKNLCEKRSTFYRRNTIIFHKCFDYFFKYDWKSYFTSIDVTIATVDGYFTDIQESHFYNEAILNYYLQKIVRINFI